MQERHEEKQATVRLQHNSSDKDYTMQEEWKTEERCKGTTGKPQEGQKEQGPRKRFIKKPWEWRKGKHHST